MNERSSSLWGEDKFQVWGGEFTPPEWGAFLRSWQWPQEARWGLWEYVSGFEINSGEPPSPNRLSSLERAELFGESGHLSARRDGDRVLWHFIGDSHRPALAGFGAESYWKTYPGETFHRRGLKSALLWGKKEKDGKYWQDDRVGWARLRYPQVSSARVRVRYWQFTRNGQVAFVWFTGFEEA